MFYGEPVRKHKHITNLSWTQFLWQFNDGREDLMQGLCLLLFDLQNVTYKNTYRIENRYENKIYVLIQSLSKKPSEQNSNLVLKCTMIEGVFLVNVNMIHDACLIIPDVGNRDENIVLYNDSRQTWVNKS